MKIKSIILTIILIQYLNSGLNAQGNVNLQVGDKDFAIWAFIEHNKICKSIYDNIQSKKLTGYSVKNTKESFKETISKLQQEMVVFFPTDPDDPTVGFDTTVFVEQSENYYFFKISGDYILLKPFKGQSNLLKLKKTELFDLIEDAAKSYFKLYISNYMVCIDSIPNMSERLLNRFNSKLFDYCKLPSTNIYANDSLKTIMTQSDKEMKCRIDIVTLVHDPKYPNDPYMYLDTVMFKDYDIKDTNIRQAIVFAIEVKDLNTKVMAISSGINRGAPGYSDMILPYGFLPYPSSLFFDENDLSVIKNVLQIKLMDRLNESENFEGIYDDYFEEN